MTTINLTNQRTQIQAALPTFQAFETALDNRLVVWDKLNTEQRRRWIIAAAGTKANPKTLAESKDPVLWLALRMHRKFADISLEESE